MVVRKVNGVEPTDGVIDLPYLSTNFRYKSLEAVGLNVGDEISYEITPDIALVFKRIIRGGSVNAAIKSIHGVEITGIDIIWRAASTYNLDGGTLGPNEVKTVDAGIYVNNTEDIYCFIRYDDKMYHCDAMISGYLDGGNRFFIVSEEL